jgi:NhaA family Na+:H+ antiporter
VSRAIAPLRDFLHRESSSGILILIASFLGLSIANSPLGDSYQSFLAIDFKVGIEEIYVNLTVLKSINYVLMTIFFFVVGLEIKRELTSGHLAGFKKAVMPFVAAVGGMALPAIIYLLIAGDVEPNGWGVPVATDIALAVGLLALVGTNAVATLRSFLLGLAVIDDIGAILIIALVYSAGVQISWVMATAFMVFWIFAFKKMGAERIWIYVLLGVSLWYCMYKSGVHPTLAGVVMGLMTPNQPKRNSGLVDSEDGSVSIIEYLESKLHPWSSFAIVPIFAFANTGVEISNDSISAALDSPIAWGIFFGLVIGKPIGVFFSTYLANKVKLGEFPAGARRVDVLATGSAAGVGFTVAIFIANLAFDTPAVQELAVFAVIVASVVSGLLSLAMFKFLGRKS